MSDPAENITGRTSMPSPLVLVSGISGAGSNRRGHTVPGRRDSARPLTAFSRDPKLNK
jgi:hypothetical protein